MTTLKLNELSCRQAIELRNDVIWQKMQHIPVSHMIEEWLETHPHLTSRNYRSVFRKLCECGLVNLSDNLQVFSMINHENILDRISALPASRATNQVCCAAYISFTAYLNRMFSEICKRAIPNCQAGKKTFQKIRDHVKTEAMNQSEWIKFFSHLDYISPRDSLIGKLALQGGKRIGEVLGLCTDQIDWQQRQIRFNQSKTSGIERFTVITYSEKIMKDLKDLIGDRQGLVFITESGLPVRTQYVSKTFCTAGKYAGISFKVTPHVLRASCVTSLISQGFSDGEIAKITGHASTTMVRSYDKSLMANNPSQHVNLI